MWRVRLPVANTGPLLLFPERRRCISNRSESWRITGAGALLAGFWVGLMAAPNGTRDVDLSISEIFPIQAPYFADSETGERCNGKGSSGRLRNLRQDCGDLFERVRISLFMFGRMGINCGINERILPVVKSLLLGKC